jgi:serine/threonine protein kinase
VEAFPFVQDGLYGSDEEDMTLPKKEDFRKPVKMPSGSPPDPFPGEFRFRQRIGRGGFGEVWLADDLQLPPRQVAIKTLIIEGGKVPSEQGLAALRKEARALVSMRHPNIVQVYAWRQAGSEHYLILQYVPGGSLKDKVDKEGALSWQLAARYIADVGEALAEAHNNGIIHRDIKPANLLWDPKSDEALLTDFGISVLLSEGTSSIAGTGPYMAPEARRGQIAPAGDVYGLAASLFWLLTKEVPFRADTRTELCRLQEQGLPETDPRLAIVPESLEDVIHAGLSAKPQDRPTLNDFVTTLRSSLNQLLADTLSTTCQPSPKPRVVDLQIQVSRQVGPGVFQPVAATQRPPSRQGFRDLKRVPPAPETVHLRTGDFIRIEVMAQLAGHLVVFNVGPTGNLNLLHPLSTGISLTPAAIDGGRPIPIVDVQLTPPAGRERIVALWTRQPLQLRLEEFARLAGGTSTPISGPYQATRDMMRVQQTVQYLAPGDWDAAVLELEHRG